MAGCHNPEPICDELVASGQVWATSPDARRAALVGSLVNPDNTYAQLRLAKYGEAEWGSLPLWNPPTKAIAPDEPTPEEITDAPLAYEEVPWTRDALIDLGRKAFFQYPVQLAPALRIAIENPDSSGLPIVDGLFGSIVWAQSASGVMPALTCASCHADHAEGDWIPGRTNPSFDYGWMLDAHVGTPSVNSTWGPGRIDVTGDGVENPTYITDLRPMAFQRRIHRAGTLYNSPTALAVRLETLLVTALSQAVRPPRKIVFALVLYLLSLSEDLPAIPEAMPGHAIFERHCKTCHSGTGLSGTSVPLEDIGTPAAIGRSPARGTGGYRIPSLRGLGDRGALLADGSIPDIDTLLNAERPTPGHLFGIDLPPLEHAELKAFLEAL